MDRVPLNEHDANQGAQSRGEFLGMDGNSGWCLLAAAGVSLLGVIVGWGLLGFSLLACLVAGFVLCLLAIGYVFGLKNNRPEHFDTDFFEAALIEAGVLRSNFGPRLAGIRPVRRNVGDGQTLTPTSERRRTAARPPAGSPNRPSPTPEPVSPTAAPSNKSELSREPVVPLAAYETIRQDLAATEDWLEEALAEEED